MTPHSSRAASKALFQWSAISLGLDPIRKALQMTFDRAAIAAIHGEWWRDNLPKARLLAKENYRRRREAKTGSKSDRKAAR